jgi:hypothetical protein
MTHTKENTKCKESVCEFKDNVDLTESIWSLLQKRIGDNLNTLEETLSSGLSSSDILEPKDIFETFRLKTSNLEHFTTPNISQ